jgi:hypothetical protein
LPEQIQPSTRSLRGLDWLNFFVADVQTGVGPVTLGLGGKQLLDVRLGRNNSFNSAGNVFAALSLGRVGWRSGDRALFFAVPALSNGVAGAVAQSAGFATSFLMLGAIALLAFLTLLIFVPETLRQSRQAPHRRSSDATGSLVGEA